MWYRYFAEVSVQVLLQGNYGSTNDTLVREYELWEDGALVNDQVVYLY